MNQQDNFRKLHIEQSIRMGFFSRFEDNYLLELHRISMRITLLRDKIEDEGIDMDTYHTY